MIRKTDDCSMFFDNRLESDCFSIFSEDVLSKQSIFDESVLINDSETKNYCNEVTKITKGLSCYLLCKIQYSSFVSKLEGAWVSLKKCYEFTSVGFPDYAIEYTKGKDVFCIYEIPTAKLYNIVGLVLKNPFKSFVIFDPPNTIKNKANIILDYPSLLDSELVNNICETHKGLLMCINGNDGVTLSYFYLKNRDSTCVN